MLQKRFHCPISTDRLSVARLSAWPPGRPGPPARPTDRPPIPRSHRISSAGGWTSGWTDRRTGRQWDGRGDRYGQTGRRTVAMVKRDCVFFHFHCFYRVNVAFPLSAFKCTGRKGNLGSIKTKETNEQSKISDLRTITHAYGYHIISQYITYQITDSRTGERTDGRTDSRHGYVILCCCFSSLVFIR